MYQAESSVDLQHLAALAAEEVVRALLALPTRTRAAQIGYEGGVTVEKPFPREADVPGLRGPARAGSVMAEFHELLGISVDRFLAEHYERSPNFFDAGPAVFRHPPGWLRARREPELAARMLKVPPAWISEGPDEMYTARVLGALCDAARSLPDPLVADYSTLTPAAVRRICDHLGVAAPAEEALAACFARDAKRGGSFVPRPPAGDTEGLRAYVERWAAGPYRRVLERASP